MYFQVALDSSANQFILDPRYENELGSYETDDGVIKVLVTNKKDIHKFCRACFFKYSATFEKKIGPFNQYVIELLGPLILFEPGIIDECPDHSETVVFSLVLPAEEVTKKDKRNPLLAAWVLGVEHPTQFNRLLKRDFDIVDVGAGFVCITKKVIDASHSDAKNGSNIQHVS